MPKVLFQLYIDTAQYNYLAQKSKEDGRSRAAIVREAISEYKKKNPPKGTVYNRKK